MVTLLWRISVSCGLQLRTVVTLLSWWLVTPRVLAELQCVRFRVSVVFRGFWTAIGLLWRKIFVIVAIFVGSSEWFRVSVVVVFVLTDSLFCGPTVVT